MQKTTISIFLCIVAQAALLHAHFVDELRAFAQETEYKIARESNEQKILMYHEIGRRITANQHRDNWGPKLLERISAAFKSTGATGQEFSQRNLNYMIKFAEEYTVDEIINRKLGHIS